LILDIILLLLGLGVIYFGGELFINGSVDLAEMLGWSKLIIGVIILGFGTSAPEIAISVLSAFDGHAQIIVGNILGSNIANVLLILGIGLALKPVRTRFPISFIYPTLIVISALLFAYGLYTHSFMRGLGISMLIITVIAAYVMIKVERNKVTEKTIQHRHNIYLTILKLISGLVLLIISAHFIIDSVISISKSMGISEAVVAASIVALGTSLPELALSIIAARKNHFDLVLGNIIGSNISNILLGIGLSSAIAPFSISTTVDGLNLGMFLISTLLLLLLSYVMFLRNRIVGILSVIAYFGFIAILYMQ